MEIEIEGNGHGRDAGGQMRIERDGGAVEAAPFGDDIEMVGFGARDEAGVEQVIPRAVRRPVAQRLEQRLVVAVALAVQQRSTHLLSVKPRSMTPATSIVACSMWA